MLHGLGDVSRTVISRRSVLGASNTLLTLEAIIDSIDAGVLVTDERGRILVFNKTAEDILGFGVSDSELPLAERIRKFGNYLPDMKTPYPIEEVPICKALRGESAEQVEIFIRNEKPLWANRFTECCFLQRLY